ncbi:LysR family transcriptional regulator [Nocardia goodfellowii]|uniref:Molybdate transport repressor ModE-like protein n=1 Tax=Nocardia goodfellowii TaxID=882446 RepID=A0ABS4QEH2_9NOCA|nr:LysR family transcriptional regulator [Nocardia goodfellowii]MBP2189545.1 molybdate transport repressor ModE-like protein [Nocardia goodfellowii]
MLDVGRLRVLVAVARTGSVTAAARELHFSQPSVSHHLARLEAETGARLIQRAGRGIRLTEAGRLLADRAAEILGRLDIAAMELSAHVGLRAGTVRVATFASAMLMLMPRVAERLAAEHPGLELELTDTHPPEALHMLRTGAVDVALAYRNEHAVEDSGVRLTSLFDDPTCLLTPLGDDRDSVAAHRDTRWIAGCERQRDNLVRVCADAGFTPKITCTTDDIATKQALVASGVGVTLIPRLALAAYRHPGVAAFEIPGSARHIYAATYGAPPDPPATRALLDALAAVTQRRPHAI